MGRPQFKLNQSNARASAARNIKPARDISDLSKEELKEHKKRQAVQAEKDKLRGLSVAQDEVLQDDDEILPGYENDCPTCGAEAGYRCTTNTGKTAAKPHAARL